MAIHIVEEANRCLGCKKAFCQIKGCPVQTPIPQVIDLFKQRRLEEAGELLFQNNPMSAVCSMVCNHSGQCEGSCIQGRKGTPVHFSSIENYISTAYLDRKEWKPAPSCGKQIAVVGSGPAGITVAIKMAQLGCAVTVQPVVPGEGADITGADFLFMGAGTERAQRFAAEDFARYSATVKAAAEDGTAMLFAGTAMELLGASVTDRDGDTYPGIGLASFTTVQGKRRIVGDVYGVTALFPEAVVGFMNKCGQIRGVEAPLLTGLSLGFGNEAEKGPEGFHWKNVFASELTGPVLVKNPRLLEAVADAICTRRGISLPEERPSFPYAEAGYAITAEQLKLRAEARQ